MAVVLRCAARWSTPVPFASRGGGSGVVSFEYREPLPLRVVCLTSAGTVSRLVPDCRGRIARRAGIRRRKGKAAVGQVLRGDCGCRLRRPDPICRRNMDYGEVWRTLPHGHIRHQCHRRLSDWSTHDPSDRAISTAPELATIPGGRCARRLHHLFELRIRDLSSCANRCPLARFAVYGGKRLAGISGCLDGGAIGRPAVGMSIGSNGARGVKC